MYELVITTAAEVELSGVRPFDGRKIVQEIEAQLVNQPGIPTRNRKMLEGLEPPFDVVPPVWELRVGAYRIFYDLDEAQKRVYVRAIRRKPPHRTTEEIL